MQTQVPVPIVLRHLIESNNQLLKIYQAELTNKVIQANEEVMQLLGLDSLDGWKLDMENLVYIKENDTPIG